MQSGTEKKSNGANVDIDGGISHCETFHNERRPDLKANYIFTNLHFNVTCWRICPHKGPIELGRPGISGRFDT